MLYIQLTNIIASVYCCASFLPSDDAVSYYGSIGQVSIVFDDTPKSGINNNITNIAYAGSYFYIIYIYVLSYVDK